VKSGHGRLKFRSANVARREEDRFTVVCWQFKMASAASGSLAKGLKQVRPILSVDNAEARKRVLNLYKAWYRQIPYIGKFIAC
jgi:hypothetical protein